MPREGGFTNLEYETRILQRCFAAGCSREDDGCFLEPERLGAPSYENPRGPVQIGQFRTDESKILATAELPQLKRFAELGCQLPAFFEAGPRKRLFHRPDSRAAIVTTGGIAPGLNAVVHAVVDRHHVYSGAHGTVLGATNGFHGLRSLRERGAEVLRAEVTRDWIDLGGSKLGNMREPKQRSWSDFQDYIGGLADSVEGSGVRVVYVVGGDGSLFVAHHLALATRERGISVVGIPKTMDNDVLWVARSFGFDTAVQEAARAIDTLHTEAESTRRICIMEFFGAESGFVAAHAALASGRADLVLVPEMFLDTDGERLSDEQIQTLLDTMIEHIRETIILRPGERHAILVVAEGVPKLLEGRAQIGGTPIGEDEAAGQQPFLELLERHLSSGKGSPRCFINRPRHYIRAVAPNVHDRIYCERLGSVAVDAGLAGFTDVMVSKRLDQYVIVPLPLVVPPPPFAEQDPGPRCYGGQRYLYLRSTFWRQVEESTGQPSWPCGLSGLE